MRGSGTHWVNKEQILDELRQGTPSNVIEKKYGIPQSTVGTWLGKLRKEEFIITQKSTKVQLKNNADFINTAEARIVSVISPIVSDDVDDDEWMKIQDKIVNELRILTLSIESFYQVQLPANQQSNQQINTEPPKKKIKKIIKLPEDLDKYQLEFVFE